MFLFNTLSSGGILYFYGRKYFVVYNTDLFCVHFDAVLYAGNKSYIRSCYKTKKVRILYVII